MLHPTSFDRLFFGDRIYVHSNPGMFTSNFLSTVKFLIWNQVGMPTEFGPIGFDRSPHREPQVKFNGAGALEFYCQVRTRFSLFHFVELTFLSSQLACTPRVLLGSKSKGPR